MPNWNFTWYDRVDENGDPQFGNALTGTTTVVDMSSPPFNVIFRSLTANAPPFRPINENVPLTPGSFLKFVDTEENEVDLTLLIKANSREELYNIMEGSATNGYTLPYIFNPTKLDTVITLAPPAPENTQVVLTGNGKLRVTTPANTPSGGVTRDLICRCISGFQIRESDLQIKSAFCPLTFYANQPYWRKSEANEFNLGSRTSQPTPPGWLSWGSLDWFQELDQIVVGSGTLYQKAFQVYNFGDVATPVTWTIRGPGRAPVFFNVTTKKMLRFSENCHIGGLQDLVINTENRTVQILGGGSLIQTINVKSEFWEILSDLNRVVLRVNNSTMATRVTIKYYERYLGVY